MPHLLFLAQSSITPVEESMSLFGLIQRGGWLVGLLFIGGIIALGVFAERYSFYKRSRMNIGEFLVGVLALVKRKNYAEAIERCEEGHGPAVLVVSTAIYKRYLPPVELREIVREVAQLQIPQLEAHVSFLATIGYLAPLVGLLGTVTGMIEAFVQLNRTSGVTSVTELSQGIYTSLITTAAGLVVAIPCYLGHNFLVAQVHAIIADMERAGIETIHTLIDTPKSEPISVPFHEENKLTELKSESPAAKKSA